MKPSKRSILWLVPILLIVALFYYFKPNDNIVDFVAYAESAVLLDNSPYTFKETFNQYCAEGNWTYFETSKRQNVVEFEGKCDIDSKIKALNFQLIVEDDLSSYKIGAMLVDFEVQEEPEKMRIIEHIYNAYTP